MKYIQYDPAEFDKITVAKADDVDALKARIAELEDMLEGVSNGVQQCRTDINMAAVWLPAIQRIREYLRAKDEEAARAAWEKKND